MIVTERRLWNKITTEYRFYLSSLSSNAEKIALAIRSHWGIENSLHWTRDVTFSVRIQVRGIDKDDTGGRLLEF